jgi:hypothetical protein
MKGKLGKNKTALVILLFFGLGLILYKNFFDTESTINVENVEVRRIGEELVRTLASLQAINFDQSIIMSEPYRLLEDFGLALPNVQQGRPNPFNIIGRD